MRYINKKVPKLITAEMIWLSVRDDINRPIEISDEPRSINPKSVLYEVSKSTLPKKDNTTGQSIITATAKRKTVAIDKNFAMTIL
ncbi:hypothetical protein SDC9_99207 [bioreactor metagenome]|uniref:Uncharacterized protein n=1 Tax=bioreactor metagenome TaxID=1076179 RepID=A0A645AIA4_9ZZZZ